MALIEAVARELGDQFEDEVRLSRIHAALGGAGDEPRLLEVHLLLLLFAHRPAQKVGFTE